MDKEKQIEEMGRDIVRMAGLDVYGKAKYLYDNHYRKITENDIVLSRSEHQHYLAYKLIEPQIKGCLDRERELERKIQELEAEQKSLISRERAQAVECKTIFNLKKQAKKDIEQSRKETAREILERGKYCMPSGLREWIEEQFGVEIGEEK